MTYERFEDLPVWKTAIELAVKIYEFTEKPPFRRRYSLRDQIEKDIVVIFNLMKKTGLDKL